MLFSLHLRFSSSSWDLPETHRGDPRACGEGSGLPVFYIHVLSIQSLENPVKMAVVTSFLKLPQPLTCQILFIPACHISLIWSCLSSFTIETLWIY